MSGRSAPRLRFAPSPSGALHLGNARTAVINALVARQTGGRLVLRVEDTDLERVEPEAERGILDDLGWLGVRWDEGPDVGGPHTPYRQSGRLASYREAARRLWASGGAYPCFCSPAEVEAERAEQLRRGEPPRYAGRCATLTAGEVAARLARGERAAIRARVGAGSLVVHDRLKGEVAFRREHLGDLVILRADERATYNFAVVVDDHAMDITDVIRGEDHLPNTPYQLVLYEASGWAPPAFAHLGLVVGPDGTPLAKRHGAMSVAEYREMGYLPQAIVAYLAGLGGGPDPKSAAPLEHAFRLERLHSGPVTFDPVRLRRVNRVKVAQLGRVELLERAAPFLRARGLDPGDARTQAAVETFREGEETLEALADAVAAFLGWEPETATEPPWRKALSEPSARAALEAVRAAVSELGELSFETARAVLDQVSAQEGFHRAVVLRDVRVALTGRRQGPQLHRLLSLLGRDRVLERLDRVLELTQARSGRPA